MSSSPAPPLATGALAQPAARTVSRRLVAKVAFSLAATGIAIWAVVGRRDELAGVGTYLDNLKSGWVAIAVGAEAIAVLCFAVLQQRLLRAGRVAIGLPSLTAITLAGNAIQNSFPGGAAWSAVWAFRQFRHRGADEVLSAWTLVGTTALSQITLIALAGCGLALSGSAGSSFDLVWVIVGLVGLSGAVLFLWRERRYLRGGATAGLRFWQRVFGRPRGDARHVVDDLLSRLTLVSPSREDWAMSTLMALGNWLWDCGCLVAAFVAVGARVPWRGLFLAYGAAQLAANLPITPGGLGVVEGSLTVALVAFGGVEASTVAAVLLYRLIAFWALLPVGWGAFGLVTARTRRAIALGIAEADG